MKIALISDIHGNLVSLEAVLEDIDKQHVDRMICLGDVVTTGPQPHEVVARLHERDIPGIMGNHEDALLKPEIIQTRPQSRWEATLNWCEKQMTDDDMNYLRSYQDWMPIPLDSTHSLLCFHGSPKSNLDLILPTTPNEEIRAMLAGHTAVLMAGGHTHVQMLRRCYEVLVMNPGSVGLPFDHYLPTMEEKRVLPWAEYAIVTWSRGALSVDLRRVPVDFEAIKRAADTSDNPFNGMGSWFTPEERPFDY